MQVEACLACHDPDTHRGDGVGDRLGVGLHVTLAARPLDGVHESDVGTRDRRSPRAAVGLQHITVDDDGVLTERREVDSGAQ